MLQRWNGEPIVFPIPPRCAPNGIPENCGHDAEWQLVDDDGNLNPGGWRCTQHARTLVDEFKVKLGETWVLAPIVRYQHPAVRP